MKKSFLTFFALVCIFSLHAERYKKRCYTNKTCPAERQKEEKQADYTLYNEGGEGKDCFVSLTAEQRKLLMSTLSKNPRKEVTDKVVAQYLAVSEFAFIGQVLKDFYDKHQRLQMKHRSSRILMRPLTFGDILTELKVQKSSSLAK